MHISPPPLADMVAGCAEGALGCCCWPLPVCEEWGLHHALLTDLPFSEVLQTISTLRQLPQGPDVQSAAQLTSAHATHLILQPPLAVLATGVVEPYPAMLLRADAALLAAVLVVAALTTVTD
jgi:hypothetical protein